MSFIKPHDLKDLLTEQITVSLVSKLQKRCTKGREERFVLFQHQSWRRCPRIKEERPGMTGATYSDIRKILENVRDQYRGLCKGDNYDPKLPISKRDLVSEIYCKLRPYCLENRLYIHTEVKPSDYELGGKIPEFDLVILSSFEKSSWLDFAVEVQNSCGKGRTEARFSSIPIEFFNTLIEVKIQSRVWDSIRDIDKLVSIRDAIRKCGRNCNCFHVLLNARGRSGDHQRIIKYADSKGIEIIEHTNMS